MATRKKSRTVRPLAESNLVVPAQLSRIQAVRDRLTKGAMPTDRPDHLETINEWERKAREALIVLSLKDNEGIRIILDKMHEELKLLEEAIRESKPTDFSPDGMSKFAHEQHALFVRKELWEWFRDIFTDAKRAIKEVDAELDTEEEEYVPGE